MFLQELDSELGSSGVTGAIFFLVVPRKLGSQKSHDLWIEMGKPLKS